ALAHPVETVKTILNPKTYIESVAQMFNPKYYEEHPGLATLNTGSNLTIVGGVVKNVLLKTATKAGINAALTEAAAHGIEGNIVTNALRTGKVPGF
ncbi:hypothetical protein LRR18_18110, partial [Mangrovimonas sp. AS39]|uniref:hypothetical protein n=1 Tax=Mangrovimonas futianensis TaxID=2895523 RepID=UPI001E39C015